jgi:hypothetical protein
MSSARAGSHDGETIANLLEEIPGVVAAAVGLQQGNRPRHVWIAASDQRPVEDVRADVVAALARLHIECPPQTLSIGVVRLAGEGEPVPRPVPPPDAAAGAQAPAAAPQTPAAPRQTPAAPPPEAELELEEEPPPWKGRFFLLRHLEVHLTDFRVQCSVEVARLDDAFTADATDVDSEVGRARAAARATLLAVEQAAAAASFALDGLQIMALFGRRYVAVGVEATANRRLSSLSAMVPIENSTERAGALAVLRAVERWVAW